MKQSTYDPLWRELLETTDTPLSVRELVDKSGASKARVHVWIHDNERDLVEVGKTQTGGRTYVWHTNTLAKEIRGATQQPDVDVPARDARSASGPGIHIGAVLTVSDLHINQGRVVVELVDETGTIYTATLNL